MPRRRAVPELPDLARYDTLPKLLALHADRDPNDVAMREKDLGIWRTLTWAEVHARTGLIALGLKTLGIGRDQVVGLIGDNRPDWVMGEIAAHAAGGLSLGIYRDVLEDELVYLLDYADVHLVIAEDEEQVDKLIGLGDRAPHLKHIIYCDPRGLRKYDDPRLLSIDALMARGRAILDADPEAYDRLVAATRGEDVAILCTTSGTTANPKLAMLRAGALLRHAASYLAPDPKTAEDEYVSVLPLPWIMEQVYVFGKAMLTRMTVNFVEEPETTWTDVREIGPTFVLLAPRVWESIAADVRSRILDSSPLKRWLYDLAMARGLRALDRGEPSWLAERLLMRALRNRLGFSRVTSAATGGAALGPETFRFFLALGVPLRQIYGQTETMGAYTVHTRADVDFDTVGVPFDAGIELKIADADDNGVGEIVTRHPNMFDGYYRNEAATAADLRDGWMHTGDAGYIDDKGHLVVIDRIKDLATTARGTRFSPQYIENKLKFSPYIAEAVILGKDRDYLAAMVCIRFSTVSKWAEMRRVSFTTYTDLSAKDEVYALVEGELTRVNASLPEPQRVRRFLLLYKELDPDDGELTRTRKVRRAVIAEKYGEIIDALYDGAAAIPVDTTIQFQDGTSQRIRTSLRVVDLVGADPAATARARAA